MIHFQRSFLQKLRSALSSLRARPRLGDIFADPPHSSRRRFHRHMLESSARVTFTVNEEVFSVIDIGYGGARIAIENSSRFREQFALDHSFSGRFNIIGSRYELRVKVIGIGEESASLGFDDLNAIDQAFLSSVLYFMDAGILLKAVPKHSVNNYYRQPQWLSYGGIRGNIEVHLHLDEEGMVDEAHVFYMRGFKQDYALFSAKGVAVTSRPARELDLREKRQILMQVLCVLVGLRQIGKTQRLDRIIAQGLTKLKA